MSNETNPEKRLRHLCGTTQDNFAEENQKLRNEVAFKTARLQSLYEFCLHSGIEIPKEFADWFDDDCVPKPLYPNSNGPV